MVEAYPMLDDDVTINLQHKEQNHESDKALVQYRDNVEPDKFEDIQVVYQKCQRNKRHVHKHVHQQAVFEDTTSSVASTLTNEEIVHIEIRYEIERLKQKILSKLHLDQPPNVTVSKPQMPRELTRKVLGSSSDGHGDEEQLEEDGKITQIILIGENGKFNHFTDKLGSQRMDCLTKL